MMVLGMKRHEYPLQTRGRIALVRFGCGWLYLLSLTSVVLFQLGLSFLAFTGQDPVHSSRTIAFRVDHANHSDKSYQKTLLHAQASSKRPDDGPALAIRMKTKNNAKRSGSARKLHALPFRRDPSAQQGTTLRNNSGGLNFQQQAHRPKMLRNETKPKIVLLAGPYKTGSSFLQCAFSRNGYDLLQRDNYFYLGTCSFECRRMRWDYEFCEKHSQGSFFSKNQLDPLFLKKLNELYKRGQNAVVVWEYLSDLRPERMMNLANALEGWDVQVILMYRRLFAWLPSWYGQKHRPIPGREQLSIWPDQSVVPRGSRVRKPGALRFPFDVYTREQRRANRFDAVYCNSVNAIESTGLHPVEQARRHWSKYVKNITVVSLHHLPKDQGAGDPLFTHLFCNVVPMNHTCHASMSNEIDHIIEGTNERFPENYDILAVYAHQRGLHPGGDANLKRPEIWRAIQRHQESVLNKTSDNFPLTCISNHSLEILLNYSVSAERDIFPGFEEEHKIEFLEAVQRKAFCSIDAEQAIGHSDWRDFFRPFISLNPHVADRDSSGSWTPEFKPNQPLQKLYFSNMRQRQPNLPRADFLGIISIGEPGRTLHKFFHQSNHLVNFPSLLGSHLMELEQVDHASLGCIYGRSASTPAQLSGTSQTCRASTYVRLVQTWASLLPHLNTTEPAAALQVSLTPVTMIQEPFDRWVSLFHSIQSQAHEAGAPADTLRQLAMADDLEGFLRHLSSLPTRNRTMNMLDAYRYTSADVNRAIDTIDGNTPRILVLIQECQELSFRLLSARFPTLVSQEGVDRFLRKLVVNRTTDLPHFPISESLRLRTNVASSVSSNSETDDDGDDDSIDLREQAREWFALDYRYYDAAVSRFLKLLRHSGVATNGTALSCLQSFAHGASIAL